MPTQATDRTPAKLTLTEFLTLDGVSQAPGGPTEDTTGGFRHGGWVVPLFDEDMGTVIDQIFRRASAFLLGRRTYEIFASHWPKVTDPADTIARGFNTLPKFVASHFAQKLDWQGTSAIRDVATEVPALKAKLSGEIQIHGSGNLAQTLIRHDLIDEYHLFIFPVLVGSGRRLFDRFDAPSTLSLAASRTTSKGVIYSHYRRSGQLATGNVILQDDGTYRMETSG